jgi:short subunit dehydrogenase-like uncharacterized protein
VTARRFEIVVFGATGFTGRLVAERLLVHGPSDLRWALAGRNRAKLEEVREKLSVLSPRARDLPILVADSFDEEALDGVARDTMVVCTTAGPYAKLGDALVHACAANGTHYCDLTGEVHFVRRSIDRNHQLARETSARIVHMCGFDSIPSDLGTLTMQEAMRARYGGHLREVRFVAGKSRGGFSGGTIASMIQGIEDAMRDPSIRELLADPYALDPNGEREGPDGRDQLGVRYDEDLRLWTGPFIMASVNTRVVRRTNALLDYPWGKDFRYSESMGFGRGARGRVAATVATAVIGAVAAGLVSKPIRAILARTVLPAPGEGPSEATRERGYFEVRFVGKGRAKDGRHVTLRGRVAAKKDPGYGATAIMLGESALCLARDTLGTEHGVLTPAAAMGMVLVERLRAAGMTFEVE